MYHHREPPNKMLWDQRLKISKFKINSTYQHYQHVLTPSQYVEPSSHQASTRKEKFCGYQYHKIFPPTIVFNKLCTPSHPNHYLPRCNFKHSPTLVDIICCYFCIIIFKVLTRLTFFFSACEPFPTFSPLFPLSLYYRRNLGREIPQP